jgi:hypothetical protein
MTKFSFIGAANTLFMDADVTMVHTTETEPFADVLTRWLADNGLNSTHLTAQTVNGDDGTNIIADTKVTPKYKIPMLKAFVVGTEGMFGFSALPPSGNQGVTHPKGRAYSASPTPPILFSLTSPGQDSGSHSSQIWTKEGVTLIKLRYAHYGGSAPGADWLILLKPDRYIMYGRNMSVGQTWPMHAATYSHTANQTTPTNNYNLGTLFAGSVNNTLVTIKYGAAYFPDGSFESLPLTLDPLDQVVSSEITWTEQLPTGTEAVVEAKLNDGSWTVVNNGDPVPGIVVDQAIAGDTVSFRVTLATTNIEETPVISNLKASVQGFKPPVNVQLNIDAIGRFHNNEEEITVTYDQNLGTLQGDGGYVESFSKTFIPVGLVPNPNPGVTDRVAVTVIPKATFFPITIKQGNGAQTSRVSASVTLVKVTLTPVGVVNP